MSKKVGKFRVNEHLVAEKPICEVIYESNRFICILMLAEFKDKWNFGYRYELCGNGAGCGYGSGLPQFSSLKKLGTTKERIIYPTQGDARAAGLQFLYNYAKREGNHPYGDSNKPVLDAIIKSSEPQLQLF